ncbi:hypothetical protein Tco_1338308 [Tanacetum coccineum]
MSWVLPSSISEFVQDWSEVLERDIEIKDNKIEYLRNEFEEVKKEKESIDHKLENFRNASKDLDDLLGNQRQDKDKKGSGDINEFVTETSCPSVSKVNNTEKSWKPTVKYAEMYREEFESVIAWVPIEKIICRIHPNMGGKILKLMKITLVQMDAQTQGRHEHDQEFDAEITTVGAKVDDIAAET